MYDRITVPDEGLHEVWLELMELAQKFPDKWTLVGAYMVALHAWGCGTKPPRRSDEPDLLMDIRLPEMTAKKVADHLVEIGWDPERLRSGSLYRFRRGTQALDVFGPENLGDKADRKLDSGRGHLLQVPGGKQALDRSERQGMRSRDREGWVPLPSLFAAALVKARAYFKRVDEKTREADLQDLAFLCGLAAGVSTPDEWLGNFEGRQRAWLSKVAVPLLNSKTAWEAAPVPERARRFLEYVI